MKKTTKAFLKLFYNKDEEICVSNSKFGYQSISQSDILSPTLISPNQKIKPFSVKEEEIVLIALNPVKGFRRDENVTAYRSFLVEVDFGSLKEQYDYILSLKMPYSICVFSGNKSLHFGIVLDEDLPSKEEWRRVAEWILSIAEKADQQTKNPTRSIRFPDNIRTDGKGMKQQLIDINSRISVSDLYKWLYEHKDKDPYNKPSKKEFVGERINGIPSWILKKLSQGVGLKNGRNNEWFSIAMSLAMQGFDKDEIIGALEGYFEEERDFTRKEWETTINSAVRKAQIQK